jgi:prevent-host-death family protein
MTSARSIQAHVTVVTPAGERIDAPRVYTMTELNQQTARVLEEVNESGRPAVITRHGRFLAMLTPLAAGQVEAAALTQGPLAEEFRGRRQAALGEPSLSADDVEAQVDGWS